MNLCCLCILSVALFVVINANDDIIRDPYVTLGLPKSASQKDVKKAYKALAKEWHPDKNDSPEAQDKFVAINQAYGLLSDPLKKERFDRFGTVDDSPQQHHHSSGFEEFFGGHRDTIFAKHRISLRQYTFSILERSNRQPYLIYAYSVYCQLCFHLKDQWQAVVDDLEPLGYGFGTVNAMMDGNLLEKLRISRLPAIVAVVEGRVIPFRESMMSMNARKVRIFARDSIPKHNFHFITESVHLKKFIDRWTTTNKISVLILGAAPDPRTRYLLTALKYSNVARFAYAHNAGDEKEMELLRSALSIKCKACENILIFNDFPENGPVARLSISNINQLGVEALNNLIEANMFLTLPRLSSSFYFDSICPVSSRNPRHICVILPVLAKETSLVDTWRTFASKSPKKWAKLNVHITYINGDVQSRWLKAFTSADTPNFESTSRDVLVLWRIEHVKARYHWIKDGWTGNEVAMSNKLEDIIKQNIRLEKEAQLIDMVDEYETTWWTKFCRYIVRTWETIWFHITREEAYMFLSVVATLVVIFLIGMGLNYMNEEKVRKEKVRPAFPSDEWHPDDPKSKEASAKSSNPQAKIHRVMSVMSPLMHELRAESYFGMIRLLKPGCRSLVLLLDEESKDRLLPQFAMAVYPLRNNKTFSFGYLMVEKNLPWFRKLLEHTLPLGDEATGKGGLYEKLKEINPKQTVGTVLSLCGWKLYFSIYHPMHTTSKKSHFLGFEDDSEDISDSDDDDFEKGKEEQAMLHSSNKLSMNNVLNGFPNWLDRLLEGSIRRYYIPEWPDNLR